MTSTIPSRMTAVQLVGHGGLDKLRYRGDVPTPAAGAGEVLLKVAAAGVNNTDINTRIGWYSKPAGGATGDAGGAGGTPRPTQRVDEVVEEQGRVRRVRQFQSHSGVPLG